MHTKFHQLHWLALAFIGLVTGCSGSVSIDPTVNIPPVPSLPPPAATEAVAALGVISGLNSVTVNGVRYETDSTTVTVNGQLANMSDLELGQIVSLEGTIEVDNPRGTANRIDYEATVIGPVESIDAVLSQLVVMGQTVRTDADTVFDPGIDPNTFAGLNVGSNAQISGLLKANGDFVATRVEADTASTGVQVIGSVARLDLANMLFTVNRLTVDYGNATVIDLPGGMPVDGMFVIVRGSLANGILIVDEILSLYDWDVNLGERVQVSGLITRFESPDDFDINGFSTVANATTSFSNGTINDLAANALVMIDGELAELTASGDAILANAITFGSVLDPTTTMAFDFANFTEISVPTVFNVTVTQGSDFSVEVTVDEDVTDRIDVTQTGTRLSIALSQGNGNIETLDASVTMPVLNSIDLTGVANASGNGFNQTQMTVNVGGVSRLQGNALMISDLTANVSGVSLLDFGDIRPIGNANIDVSGVSQATLNMNVGSTMTGSVGTGQGTGVSKLFYYGTNVTVNVTTDGLSSVVILGETRP
jgi:hypothetical protein